MFGIRTKSLLCFVDKFFLIWSGAREAESGSLLRSCAPKGYRGFESPLLRNKKRYAFFILEFYCVKLHPG
jgi:hypothetical protein